ncbi:gamma-glutamylcyclotransferase [Gracilibacillus caseinilyticus]|uniref:Gamma-glutamylcyclotransferase family protein n=1 Tax=Gracilibacillus caseinilyticus TaxID=2932256 RepID=A0ABY4F064_9BACI|nr:gamma-glutamylcyclotransferase family protein [Gracilibacillus caseinilyticus]UOQ49905.1 gamma-glutamylcyclotransferase [Gracilibacillus caseinilyticus]
MSEKMVFVYGTLRKHQSNASFIKSTALVASQTWTLGRLYDVGVGYPAMVKDPEQKVYGELYKVDHNTLREMDLLEGYHGQGLDNLYERGQQTIYMDIGEVEACVYTFREEQTTGLREIKSGDWKVDQLLSKTPLYYFAYGSCMDQERMVDHHVAKYFTDIVGGGSLQSYQLAFTISVGDGGRADIIEGDGMAEGKVYRIGVEALAYLIEREGVEEGKYRPTFVDVEVNGDILRDVLTFVVADKQPETAPPEHYAKEIIRGGKACLSTYYLQKLEKEWKEKFAIDIRRWL